MDALLSVGSTELERSAACRRGEMTTPIVIDCDPGHDDAIAILLALASPEVELVGITTVAGNQTLDKTTRNALVTLEIAGRTDIPVAAGAEAPLRRELRTAAHVHGETGLDGPELPEPSARPVEAHAADFLAELIEPGVVLVPTGAAHERRAHARAPPGRARPPRADRLDGRRDRGGKRHAGRGVQRVRRPGGRRSGVRERDPGHDDRARRHAQGALRRRAHAERLRDAGRAGRFVAELVGLLPEFHEQRYRFDGSPIHDAMAVAHVIDPTLVDDAATATSRSRRGRSTATAAPSSICAASPDAQPNADVGIDVDAERFLELLVSRIASLP